MAGKLAVALAACAVCLAAGLPARSQAPAEPPYVFVLRSRDAVVTPERTKHAETGGGFIQVTQITPNVVMFLMRGAVVAGEDHGGRAALQFRLNQDLDILATRPGLRRPRLVATSWLIGTLDSSLRNGGTAEQSPACATFRAVGDPIIQMCVKPHGVAGGENLLVNERVGPLEAVVAPGPYCLSQTFALNAVQERTCYAGSAAAHFDPDPRLDSRWNEVLKPFRAVPKQNFGFRVILRVVEDISPAEAAPPAPPTETLPPPQPVPQVNELKPTPPVLNGDNRTP